MTKKKRHVLIAGGGIGGMAAALALLRRGIDVDVYEQASEMREVGAGVQISPNGSRALHALGVFEALRSMSCAPDGKEIRHWQSGKTWKLFELGGMAIEKYGFPYLTVYRPDLLQVLTDAVRSLKPDAVHLHARCTGVTERERAVTLSFDNGQSAIGDAIVGADGVHSRVRHALFGDDRVNFAGLIAWRALLPMHCVPAHMVRMVGTNWIGPGGHVVHYPLQGGKVMNFVATREAATWDADGWKAEASVNECARVFDGWHPDIHALLRQARSVLKWALLGREPLPLWSRGRSTLLGDACHPTLPFLGQGANMAIEDGVVLARCLAENADVEAALQRYESLRMERTYRMVREASAFTPRFHHPALADPARADDYISREWGSGVVSARYDWLFEYDVNAVAA
jgi:salicylate hydroxylase